MQRIGFEPFFFEWYKFVASLANVIAFIEPISPNFRQTHKQSYYVLSGLLHRCARLMFSNVALSFEGEHGETSHIVDRCLSESAIIIQWICQKETEERALRYISSGLKPEVELENQINLRIAQRGGARLPIETRMLDSIQRTFDAAQMTRDEALNAKKMPDFFQILTALGNERLEYTVTQRLASHSVHGSWVSLIIQYLDKTDDADWAFRPRGSALETHINQYVHGIRHVLNACIAYANACFDRADDPFTPLCEDVLEKILDHYLRAIDLGA